MRLLEMIYKMSNEIYLSDFKFPIKLQRHIDLIRSIPDDMFPLEEWQYVCNYILGNKKRCTSVRQAKQEIIRYACFGQ